MTTLPPTIVSKYCLVFSSMAMIDRALVLASLSRWTEHCAREKPAVSRASSIVTLLLATWQFCLLLACSSYLAFYPRPRRLSFHLVDELLYHRYR